MVTSSTTVRQILGPLTTAFTPPATCSTVGVYSDRFFGSGYIDAQCFTSYTNATDGSVYTTAFDGIGYDYTCLPSSTLSDIRQTGFYSPGVVCPVGYASACTGGILTDGRPLSVDGHSFSFNYALEPGETGIGCCPESFYCLSDNACVSQARTGAVLEVTQCIGEANTLTSTFKITVTSPTSVFTAYAPMVQIVYKSSDLEFITIERPTTTVTTTAGADSGLTTGDKAGIGVGVVAILLLIVALVFGWLLLRHRRRTKNDAAMERYKHTGHPSSRVSRKEIGSEQMNELNARSNRSELAGRSNESELPG